MSDNVKVLLVGAGRMAEFYCDVFKGMNIAPMIITRGDKKARKLEEKTGYKVYAGGIEKAYSNLPKVPTHVIVATNVETLKGVTNYIIEQGVNNILIEKPAGLNYQEIFELNEKALGHGTNVFVAYNRRYYASVQKALEIINEDGGVSSINYEFTEWSNTIKNSDKAEEVKQNWLLANSTHVIDLAFFLAGRPKEMKAYTKGSLGWHLSASVFCGSGITENNIPFTYQANWEAPGRWGVEVLTKKHRLYLRPMEKLFIQEIDSVTIKEVELDDGIDKDYKPGLFEQVQTFLGNIQSNKAISLSEHLKNAEWYRYMENK